jgi:hypothetical protein
MSCTCPGSLGSAAAISNSHICCYTPQGTKVSCPWIFFVKTGNTLPTFIPLCFIKATNDAKFQGSNPSAGGGIDVTVNCNPHVWCLSLAFLPFRNRQCKCFLRKSNKARTFSKTNSLPSCVDSLFQLVETVALWLEPALRHLI